MAAFYVLIPQRDGGQDGKNESDRTRALIERQFKRKSKSHTYKRSRRSNSFTIFHGQAGVEPPQEKQGFITRNSDLRRQTPSLQISPPSFLFCQTLYAQHDGISYGMSPCSTSVSCPTVALPNSLCVLILLAGGVGCGAENALAVCKGCSAVAKTPLS